MRVLWSKKFTNSSECRIWSFSSSVSSWGAAIQRNVVRIPTAQCHYDMGCDTLLYRNKNLFVLSNNYNKISTRTEAAQFQYCNYASSLVVEYLPPPLSGLVSQSESRLLVEMERFLPLLLPLLIRK